VALPKHIILPVAFLSIPLILSLSLLCYGAERRTIAPPRNGTVAAYRAEGKRHPPNRLDLEEDTGKAGALMTPARLPAPPDGLRARTGWRTIAVEGGGGRRSMEKRPATLANT
jgi:hypothetical protein